MDYEKAYKEALERAKKWYYAPNADKMPTYANKIIPEIFPELKESEDGKMRAMAIKAVYAPEAQSCIKSWGINPDDVIAWLEKQGKQKLDDRVEPKFKVGDWVVYNRNDYSREIMQIYDIRDGRYYFNDNVHFSWSIKECDEKSRLWTIQDAKDGDVLVTKKGNPFLYDKNRYNNELAYYYVGLDVNKELVSKSHHRMLAHFGKLSGISPATKEQCDLLFTKMKEAGYEWDAEKKELKKIEQKPEINDDVLSRFAFYQYDNDTIYLSSLFVRESDRKCGYGSKIMKAAEEVAKTFGISKIRLKVESNTWMEEWYKKNGYEYLSAEGEYDWLEKQVEQKPTDEVKPKFKVGDFILNGDITNKGKPEIFKILKVCSSWYDVENIYDGRQTMITFAQEYTCKPWTIQDAKDGDVLCCENGWTCIFKALNSGISFSSYCFMDSTEWFCETGSESHTLEKAFIKAYNGNIYPATKEQRDLLFQKMKDVGYEWNSEKKELKKIEQASSWSEDDEVCLDDAMWKIEQAMGNLWRAERWLESVKERMKGE